MDVQLSAMVIRVPLTKFLHFQERMYMTFKRRTLIIHARDDARMTYTKTTIDKDQMEFFENKFLELRTYESKIVSHYLYAYI